MNNNLEKLSIVVFEDRDEKAMRNIYADIEVELDRKDHSTILESLKQWLKVATETTEEIDAEWGDKSRIGLLFEDFD